jgi:hypothetical protein
MSDDIPMLPPIGVPFKRGEFVLITCNGRTVEGMVTLASPNGRSLMLMFEAILDGYAGKMQVFQRDDGTFVAIINSAPVEIRRKHEAMH